MKQFKSLLVLMLFFFLCAVSAQNKNTPKDINEPPMPPQMAVEHPGMPLPIPDLSKEQIEQIKKADIELKKTILPLLNKIGELEAKLRSESTAEAPLMKELDRLIDEIGTCKSLVRKAEMKMHQDVRKLLSAEQRLMFDMLPPPVQQPEGRGGQPCMAGKPCLPKGMPPNGHTPEPMPR